MNEDQLPATAGEIAEEYPEIWQAYAALGEAVAESGPLNQRERRLVKLALAIGAASEGAVHSHVRRAEGEGIEAAAVEQVAMLAIPTLGFPRAAAAFSWIRDSDDEDDGD
jgi:alkylhydroperoxidase/carboxymuconolactone decarboxylase family protein YurZ